MLLPGLDGTEVFFAPLLAALPEWVKPLVVTYPASGANCYSDLLELVRAAVEDEADSTFSAVRFPDRLHLCSRRSNGIK